MEMRVPESVPDAYAMWRKTREEIKQLEAKEDALKTYLKAMIPENKQQVQGIVRVEVIRDNIKYKDYSEDLIRYFVPTGKREAATDLKRTFSNPTIVVSFKEAGE